VNEPLILDRYRPLAGLGAGGYGSVTLAFDTRMARRVAIKRLALSADRSGRAVRTGLAEARTAALLNHPNIVTVHEWDSDDRDAYIVMEAVEGASLAELLDEGGPLGDDEAAAVIEAVGSAVSYAHDNGVLHLDLKPENVLVARDGTVKVADFGISALTDATGRAHALAGTIGYMPPEQIRGEHLDERADVWALAALAYEMLTDANPFDSDSAEGSLFKIEVADVPAPSEFEPGLPAALDDALLDALAPDPRDRPFSVRELLATVLPLLRDPRDGRESLAATVGVLAGDEDAEWPTEATGLWARWSAHARLATRIGAAVASGWLMWAGGSGMGLDAPAVSGAAALAALGGAIAPGLGLALGVIALTAGLLATFGWGGAVALGAVAAIMWVLRWRAGDGDAVVPFAALPLGVARVAPALPLLAGLGLRPLHAALASGFAGSLLVAASALCGGQAPYQRLPWQVIVDPWGPGALGAGTVAPFAWPWLLVPVAWSAAAAVCSALAGRQTRLAAVTGVCAGAGVLAGAYALAGMLAGGAALPVAALAPDLAGGTALALLAVAAGAPVRSGPE
jgi:hypothetical protein